MRNAVQDGALDGHAGAASGSKSSALLVKIANVNTAALRGEVLAVAADQAFRKGVAHAFDAGGGASLFFFFLFLI